MPREEVGHVAPKSADEIRAMAEQHAAGIAKQVRGVTEVNVAETGWASGPPRVVEVRGAAQVESDDELLARIGEALLLPDAEPLREKLRALVKPAATEVAASGSYSPRQAMADGRIAASGLAGWEARFKASPAAVSAQLRTLAPALDGAVQVAAAARSVSVRPRVARASASSKLKRGEDGALSYDGIPTRMVAGEVAVFTFEGWQSVSSFEATGGKSEEAAFALDLAHSVPDGPTGKLFAEGPA